MQTNNWRGPSRPSTNLLEAFCTKAGWNKAQKEALRSPMVKFKVGAVLWEPTNNQIISYGTSHPDVTFSKVLASMHAEQHALNKVRHIDLEGCWCLIYSLNARGGCPYTSRPCYSCARHLYNRDITRVLYPERKLNGSWIVQKEHPEELLSRATTGYKNHAREMRIPALTP